MWIPHNRHTYVTTSFDAGVSLRDVQIAARHADPKTTMRYDREGPCYHFRELLSDASGKGLW